MKTKVLPLLAVAIVLTCEEPASEIFAECGKDLITSPSKNVTFPFSELGIKVPENWFSVSLEDERVKTIYSADSTLFAQTNKILAISLSSSKTKFEASSLETVSKDFFQTENLNLIDEGKTTCYGENCLYLISRDTSMMYGSFLFIEGQRLHIINLTTSSDTGEYDRFCALMSLLTNVNME